MFVFAIILAILGVVALAVAVAPGRGDRFISGGAAAILLILATAFTVLSRRVEPQINAAITSVFASFDPLGTINVKTGDAPAPDLNKTYREPLMTAVVAALGNDIKVRSIAFERPVYDKPTTDAIAAYGKKVLEARNLQIDKANAITRAEITNTDAKVDQVARCLQIAEKLGKEPGLCMGSGVTVTKPVS